MLLLYLGLAQVRPELSEGKVRMSVFAATSEGTTHAIPPNYNHTMLGLACHTPQSQGEEGWGAGEAAALVYSDCYLPTIKVKLYNT